MVGEKETYLDIKGYEGLYLVSTLGNIYSVKNKQLLKPIKHTGGYMRVMLYKYGNGSLFKVHRLVAQAFIPNPENKPQVNHIDEDKTNNMVSNLEWVTAKENVNHGTRNERSSKKQGMKIKAIDIASGEYNIYNSQQECAKRLNLTQSSISQCVRGNMRETGGYIFEKITNEL